MPYKVRGVPFENCGAQKHMRTYAHTIRMCVPSTIPIDDSSSKLLILSDVQSDVSSSALLSVSYVSSDGASSDVHSESSIMPSAIPSDVLQVARYKLQVMYLVMC